MSSFDSCYIYIYIWSHFTCDVLFPKLNFSTGGPEAHIHVYRTLMEVCDNAI